MGSTTRMDPAAASWPPAAAATVRLLPLLAALGAAVAVSCATRLAAARSAAVLPLHHSAPVTAREAAIVGDALRHALKQQEIPPVDPAVVRRLQEVIPADACTSQSCMNRIAELVDAKVLAGGRLQREQSDAWTVQLWIYDSREQLPGEALRLATTQDRCLPCDLSEVSAFSARLLASLLQKARTAGQPASLQVRSRPPGAVVHIDGTAMGVTDMTFGLNPGRHVVTLTKPGYRESVHQLRIEPGARAEIDAVLAAQADRDHRGLRRHLGWLKWTVAGTAAAVAGTGIALWAAGRPAADSGSGAVDRELTNYRPPGIALTVVGGALAAAAVTLFVVDRPGARARADHGRAARCRELAGRLVVGAGPGDGGLTYVHRF